MGGIALKSSTDDELCTDSSYSRASFMSAMSLANLSGKYGLTSTDLERSSGKFLELGFYGCSAEG